MTTDDSTREPHGSPRPVPIHDHPTGDLAVGQFENHEPALPTAGESSYGAEPEPDSRSSPPGGAADRTRAVALRLTTPEVVQISESQYRQAVDLLAAMIVSWVQRHTSDSGRHKRKTRPHQQTGGGA